MNDDINFTNLCINESDKRFNSIIGHIEDMLMEDEFLRLHDEFMEKYWQEFDDTEENKFVYTDIFKEYQNTIEKYIERGLNNKLEGFCMKEFEDEMKSRQNEFDGEIFDLLSSFSDFLEFKQKFLDYKAVKEGQIIDFSNYFYISKYVGNDN
ncbi:ADP-ribosylation factor-like protein 2-binding protein [Onthophagus taurus]|uniref:ADP-ribosylation factor-like protein 2-binding protein n=1 Tax=Onthophagus taurus TaxID=166361 RepID=UPI000C20E146|nr:ADP-ribosylation factor-like protein 2-binding protein [Onthophagus taurus]